MKEFKEKDCPDCGQRLRFPQDIGGLVMVCPSCGKKFHSDFKVGSAGGAAGRRVQRSFATEIFEMPGKIMDRLLRMFS